MAQGKYDFELIAYQIMDNHFHLLVRVPHRPEGFDVPFEEVMRLWQRAVGDAWNRGMQRQFEIFRENGSEAAIEAWRQRMLARMFSLSEFMKALKQRFTQWYNRRNGRDGTLWGGRYKSVIVQDEESALRTMATYIDLNPVRAGMVKDPAGYRWSSYGEAIGGGKKGNGKKAREGLVRAYFCDQGVGFEAEKWQEVSRSYRRLMGLALGRQPRRVEIANTSKGVGQSMQNTAEMLESMDNGTVLKDLGMAKMLRCRVRYFTDGAVIGSKEFVNEAFASARERFGAKRKDGARAMRGSGSGARGLLWSLRDLRKGVA